ncbi:Exonuclease family protein [Candida albicans]|uniref:RNA exonuclease 3 n=1 Tax=Candida albicans TaxID=5476 RepID=A0A8H6F0D6_CANAX|nr:Exonuclease family protein [Candida albicans]
MKSEIEIELGADDPLSKSTARLSICQADMEEETEGNQNPRLQVRELLQREKESIQRRDSAVSLNSFLEEDEENDQQQSQSQQQHLSPKKKSRSKKAAEKRRRSSAHSFSIAQQQPPLKREKVHKRKLKKRLQPPNIELLLDKSEENSNKDSELKRFPFRNLRSLILKVFNVPGTNNLKWCNIENSEKIPTVCVCLVPGLQLEENLAETADNGLQSSKEKSKQQCAISNLKRIDQLSFIFDNFTNFIKSSSPGSKDSIFSSLQTLLNVPLTKNEKNSLLRKSKATKITIKDLLLTEQQLKTYNYPTTLVDSTWKATKDLYNTDSNNNEKSDSETRKSRIYALDCEFCKAGAKQVLTRISLLDFEAKVVMDELVKPKEEITDYVTKYSGITEELLRDVTTTIEDIQNLFVNTVSQQDILIGHSLESDLNVMKIKHDNIVDTSIIYEHNRGPPSKPSLKSLAEKHLNRQIQAGEGQGLGHSSIEDAKACLDLVKLKIIEGKLFGVNVDGNNTFKSLLVSYGQTREYDINPDEKYDLTKINVTNDDEAVENFVKEIHSKNFAVINLRDSEFNNKWNTPPDYYKGDLDYNQMESYKRTNQRLEKIYQSLPDHSLLICYSQSGDPREMFKLQGVRRNFQKCEKEGIVDVTKLPEEESWTFTKSEKLLEQTSLARESLMFIKIKPSSDTGSYSINNLSTETITSVTPEISGGGGGSSSSNKDIE